jgi:integrase
MTIKPHLLRHTYATRMTNIIGPESLQQQLGHEFLSTTLGTYYHQDPEHVGQEVVLGIDKLTKLFEEITEEYEP